MTFQTPLSSDSDLRWSLNSTFKMFLSCSYYRSSTRDRNRGQLKFRCHVGPKTVFQDGSDRTKIFKNNHFGLVYDMIYQFLGIGGLPMCVLQSCLHYTLRGINYTFEGWITHYTSRVVDYTFRYTQTTHFIFIEFSILGVNWSLSKECLQISNIKMQFFQKKFSWNCYFQYEWLS